MSLVAVLGLSPVAVAGISAPCAVVAGLSGPCVVVARWAVVAVAVAVIVDLVVII